MVLGLLIAFGMVALIVGLLFRSLRMTLISLVPNVLPLLFIAGFMGVLDIDLKVSTSIIFTIAFGIAVDDTLHFLAKYRILLQQGRQPIWALGAPSSPLARPSSSPPSSCAAALPP